MPAEILGSRYSDRLDEIALQLIGLIQRGAIDVQSTICDLEEQKATIEDTLAVLRSVAAMTRVAEITQTPVRVM